MVAITATIAACVGYVHLSTTEQLAVVPNQATFQFGDVEVGTTSGSQTIVISPASGSGDSVDHITSVTFACSDFSVTLPGSGSGSGSGSGFPIEVSRTCAEGSGSGTAAGKPRHDGTTGIDDSTQGAGCQSFIVRTASFPATFKPTASGAQNCQVFFNGTFGTLGVTLTGTGKAAPFVISTSPSNLDFGDVRINNTSRIVSVIVKNEGSMPLNITSVALDSGAVFDVDGSTGNHTLAVGAGEKLDVTCAPTQVGVVSTVMRINSNATGGQVAIPLRCNGIDSDLVAFPGSPIDLDTRVGAPIEVEVAVTNTGTGSATINSVAVVDTTDVVLINAPAPGLVLVPLTGNFKVKLRYAAGTPQSKINNGKLRILHDTTQQQELVISTEALEAEIGANPDGVNFGPVCAGTTVQQDVAVFSTKPGGFAVNSFSSPDAPFSVSGTPGAVAGNHADERVFTASVMPIMEGPASSIVTVGTDIPGKPSRDFVLEVIGLPAGISGSPALGLDFGSPALAVNTLARSAKLTNCSGDDLMVTGQRIEGEAAADFLFVGASDQQPLERSIAPTASVELLVIMTPQLSGERIASLVIEHSQGETSIPLQGVGIGELPLPEDPQGPETYYQCSSGGRGSGMVGFAVLALLVRRRRRR